MEQFGLCFSADRTVALVPSTALFFVRHLSRLSATRLPDVRRRRPRRTTARPGRGGRHGTQGSHSIGDGRAPPALRKDPTRHFAKKKPAQARATCAMAVRRDARAARGGDRRQVPCVRRHGDGDARCMHTHERISRAPAPASPHLQTGPELVITSTRRCLAIAYCYPTTVRARPGSCVRKCPGRGTMPRSRCDGRDASWRRDGHHPPTPAAHTHTLITRASWAQHDGIRRRELWRRRHDSLFIFEPGRSGAFFHSVVPRCVTFAPILSAIMALMIPSYLGTFF
jgi:hypothetical protein